MLLLNIGPKKVDQGKGKYYEKQRGWPLENLPSRDRQPSQVEFGPRELRDVPADKHENECGHYQHRNCDRQSKRDGVNFKPGARFANVIRPVQGGYHRGHPTRSRPECQHNPEG